MTKILFVKIKNKVWGTFYFNKDHKYSVLYAKGAPSNWDSGSKEYQEIADKYKVNILIPDYIGYARSNSSESFNFSNCIQTIEISLDFLEGRIFAKSISEENINLRPQTTLLIGGSFGGGIVPLFNQYTAHKKHQWIGLLAPITDWKTQADGQTEEESMDEFCLLLTSVYENVYKNFKKSEFYRLAKKDKTTLEKYNPIDNICHLINCHLYIAHGDKDRSINWKKSQAYFSKVKELNPKAKFKLLKNIPHGGPSSKKVGLGWIIENFLKDIPKASKINNY